MPRYHFGVFQKGMLTALPLFFFATLAMGQCPDKKFLEGRMAALVNSSQQKDLSELSGYLDKIRYCPYRNDSTHARLARRIGWMYAKNGDYLNGVKYFSQCVNIITTNADRPAINITDLPGSYYWLSTAYESLNMVKERMTALDSCYKVSMRINYVDYSTMRALYEWGQYFFNLGDYHRCIDYMQRCESLLKAYPKIGLASIREEFMSGSLLWQTKALLELKQYEEAEKTLNSRMEDCKRAGQYNNLGAIFSQLAELQLRKGNYKKALFFYTNAFKNDQRAGYNLNCKQTLKDIGYNIHFLHDINFSKALEYYKRALSLINKDTSLKAADMSESVDLYRLIATLFCQQGQYDLAYHYFQEAFDQINLGTNEMKILQGNQESIIQFKKIHHITSLIIDKGDAYRRQFETTMQRTRIQEAIRVYKAADQFLDKIRTAQPDLESKLFWRSDSRRLYEHAIDACYLASDFLGAFYFFEKSRAVLLQDQLNEQKSLGLADIMKQTQLNKRILPLERELKTLDDSSKAYSDLHDELFSLQKELQNAKEVIKTTNPLYYQNFMSNDSVTIKDVQERILENHQALVELFDGDSAVYVFVISKQRSYLQKINKTAFENLSTAYVRYLSDPDLLNRSFDSFTDISNQLYQLIFGKINLPPGRIIISPPDGRYFPFESLVTKQKPHTYFVENYAVSYTYSARYLLNNFLANLSSSSRTFIGIAPVRFSGLGALTGSDQSLKNIRRYFRNAASFVGAKATKNNFLKEYYRYEIIQLYTHATDSSSSGDPAISFADSTLLLSDLLYENRPASSLIVLSACETGNGRLYNGEGVFSFNRQFAALGIPSCVSTLWQADNKSTYEITEIFYKYLSKGEPLDVALQSAKKEFYHSSNREHQLPYYWAVSILVGKSDSIQLQKPLPWKWATAAAAVLALVGLGIWWAKRRKSQKSKKIDNLILQS